MFVYALHNAKTMKNYVGATVRSVRDRVRGHKNKASSRSTAIAAEIDDYGIDSFEVIVLAECSTHEELHEEEVYWTELLQSNDADFGYNMKVGGLAPGGTKFSEEARAKISRTHKGRPLSAEHRRKISKGQQGKKRPDLVASGRLAKLKPWFKEGIAKLKSQGLTQKKIAERYGVHRKTLALFCKKHGI